MPKITIDNTKGLVQASGAGLNLFGQAAQSLTAAAAGANALILTTSTVVLMDSADNAHQLSFPRDKRFQRQQFAQIFVCTSKPLDFVLKFGKRSRRLIRG